MRCVNGACVTVSCIQKSLLLRLHILDLNGKPTNFEHSQVKALGQDVTYQKNQAKMDLCALQNQEHNTKTIQSCSSKYMYHNKFKNADKCINK